MEFTGKTIIVTGASSGIGLASAKLFSELGANLVIASRSIDRLNEIRQTLARPQDTICVKCDVSVEEDCKLLVESAIRSFGKIDILVNNAGISMRAMFLELDLKVIRQLMDVNFWGTVYCTKYSLEHLLRSKGQLVGVISVAGYSALPARTGYSASKYAVRGFLDAVRIEHLKDGLNVLVFAPGYTASNVRKAALLADGNPQFESPLNEGKLMSAEHCALELAKALYKRKSTVTLTFIGKLTVAAHNLFPRLTDRLTYRYISKEKDSPF